MCIFLLFLWMKSRQKPIGWRHSWNIHEKQTHSHTCNRIKVVVSVRLHTFGTLHLDTMFRKPFNQLVSSSLSWQWNSCQCWLVFCVPVYKFMIVYFFCFLASPFPFRYVSADVLFIWMSLAVVQKQLGGNFNIWISIFGLYLLFSIIFSIFAPTLNIMFADNLRIFAAPAKAMTVSNIWNGRNGFWLSSEIAVRSVDVILLLLIIKAVANTITSLSSSRCAFGTRCHLYYTYFFFHLLECEFECTIFGCMKIEMFSVIEHSVCLKCYESIHIYIR